MYEERKNNFSFKDLILQILVVVLLVFILLWLFPTKSYIKNYVDDTFTNKLQPLYNQIYAQNLDTMKEASISYFTTDRLPSKVGDSITMTLGEMQEKKLVLDLKDTNNNSCSLTESYVKLTKKDKEYVLTVKLSCSDVTDYIDVYLGCYNYCPSGVCEKKEPVKKPTTVKPTTTVKYQYEYEKITNGKWGEWSDWSKWELNSYTQTDYRRVETKKSTVQTGTELVYKDAKVNTTCTQGELRSGKCYIPVSSSRTETASLSCPSGYTLSGSKCTKTTKSSTSYSTPTYKTTSEPVCPSGYTLSGSTCTRTYSYNTGEYTDWVRTGTATYSSRQTSSNTTKYALLGSSLNVSCGTGCTTNKYTYAIYTRSAKTATKTETVSPTYKTTTTPSCSSGSYDSSTGKCVSLGITFTSTASPSCPSGYTLSGSTCYRNVSTTEYSIVNPTVTYSCADSDYKLSGTKCVKSVPVYTTYTYYRYQTREFISGTKDTKWSLSKTDKTLLEKGYVLTGNKKVVK
ncbi:MAG: hypothetical protein NC181_01930 [Clostridium sp.]|nr:hypothetical protein [Clostridium sp.]MCM1444065.1 hypothetical protein [Candidatus Amulumruptor caecigallinarius]